MVNLYRLITGYVRIRIFGELPERFINTCTVKGISIWGISRKAGHIDLNLSMSDYKGMLSVRRSIGYDVKVRLLGKYGLPIRICSLKRRPGICIGLLLFMLINVFLSQFIWVVDVVGNQQIESSEIIKQCEDMGIRKGIFKNSVNTYDAAQILALRLDSAAWVSLNIEGSKLTVNISEATAAKPKDESLSGNLIASHDGVVKRIEAVSGTKSIKVNQAVQKGDLLVSGIVDYGGDTHFVKSQGSVIAETQRVFTETVDVNYTVNRYTGELRRRASLEFFWLRLPLYLSDVEGSGSTYFNRNSLKMFGVELPVALAEKRYLMYVSDNVELTEEQAVDVALSRIVDKIRTLGIIDVLSTDMTVSKNGESYTVKLQAVCLEDIAEYQAIDIVDD